MNLANLRGLFTRRVMIRFAISVAVSAAIGMVAELALDHHARAEASALQAQAYESISQFAPWSVAEEYFSIIIMPDAGDAQAMAWQRQQQEFKELSCKLAMNTSPDACAPPAPRFYISAHVPIFLRPVTAFVDLLLHLFADNGWIGALVAAAQIALGIMATMLVGRRAQIGFESWPGKLIGIPIAIMVLGSVVALPLWGLALLGMMLLKAVPLGAMGAQTGATAYMASWLGSKAAEELGHEVVMKQVERVVRD